MRDRGGRTVGIVGAGQLARMMAQAAIPLDIRLVLLAASASDGAARVVPDVIVGNPDDPDALDELARRCDVITFDHELVDPRLLADLERQGHRVWPSSSTMSVAQDKRRQRTELSAAGMPVPAFAAIESLADIEAFGAGTGWPVVLKASRGGYDGRGVWIVQTAAAARSVLDGATANGTVLLAEQCLPLDREFAVIVARREGGEVVTYPVTETVQRAGICRELRVPCALAPNLAWEAEDIAISIAGMYGLVGIMAVEFFLVGDRILVNELAPRPHNSGHWTIEGAATSQFAQHLRAVLDLPLGATAPTAPAIVTINLLGPDSGADPWDRLAAGLATPGAHVHLYGKTARPGRKLGHVTAVGETLGAARGAATSAAARLLDKPGNPTLS
ncbi:MAG: N5-carboxyaminoimidazole ribonucleotide synthase [uncultured Thermomicrobiales bacterium]|uniref:N5-carboxyaminoimidazole ribonucleotide synthase n=1 Tax=uncultured Thermomicrobiales bacterium TaxID=1645740 RepID=A0A6J4VP06_9BACT|nr:MAG: N5-carboxyaminoimidazole ribonucleotide synthase [uncultured Thermomicrobiales bacterium]